MPDTPKLLSPCHNATISAELKDRVLIGSCSSCNSDVVRANPRTGVQEWLDGNSPWTKKNLRQVANEYQNSAVMAFLPVFGLRSPCHCQPIIMRDYMGQMKVGVCPTCNNIFARINPANNRVERVVSEDEILSPKRMSEYSEAFQPRRSTN